MSSGFYRRRWDETRGDEFDGWGRSVWYFEVDDGAASKLRNEFERVWSSDRENQSR